MSVQLTSVAKHDHYLLKEVHLPKNSTLAMDRGYVDIAQFQRLTEEGVCYVTKMKKNLKFEILESVSYTNTEESVTHIDQKVRFTRGELTHEAQRVEIFYETKKPVVLLTNNFEFTVEDISEIYRIRWAIESLYKQLKQNFPLLFSMETASTPYKYRHGGSDCQSADNSSVKKHQKTLCIIAGCYHGTAYACVLR